MSTELEALDRFIKNWREPLEQQAEVRFEARLRDDPSIADTAIANDLVKSINLQPIGFNWEMLDASHNDSAPRSAIASFSDALSNNMVFSHQAWLGEDRAKQCGRDFIDCFAPLQRTILTNRLDIGWNPISAATFEWAFIGFDDRKIALLLLMAED